MIFYKAKISINYEEITLKFFVLSLAKTGTILPIAREITPI
jgi:hypothetical protein